MASLSAQFKKDLLDVEARLLASLKAEVKVMENSVVKKLKNNVGEQVTQFLKDKEVVGNVLRQIGGEDMEPVACNHGTRNEQPPQKTAGDSVPASRVEDESGDGGSSQGNEEDDDGEKPDGSEEHDDDDESQDREEEVDGENSDGSEDDVDGVNDDSDKCGKDTRSGNETDDVQAHLGGGSGGGVFDMNSNKGDAEEDCAHERVEPLVGPDLNGACAVEGAEARAGAGLDGDCAVGDLDAGVEAGSNELPPISKSTNVKYINLCNNPPPSKDFCFGPGLNLSFKDLLDIGVCIPPDNPMIMDSCVMVLRETILAPIDQTKHPRVDILPTSFVFNLAKQFSKFKKSARKESFEFDQGLVSDVVARFVVSKKEWVRDIDCIYFPFNLDRNRWVGVRVDFRNSSLTVFDATSNVCRGPRFKPEFDFLCDMLPWLVRKAAANEQMEKFKVAPLSFLRDATVMQAADRAHTGMIALLLIEAHATGGREKANKVKEGVHPSSCSAACGGHVRTLLR